jgi:hypothetical protein
MKLDCVVSAICVVADLPHALLQIADAPQKRYCVGGVGVV